MSCAIGVGLIGLGNVGTGVVRLLSENPGAMERRQHADFRLCKVAVNDPDKPREVDLAPGVVTGDVEEVLADDAVDVVIEVTGALPAFDWIRTALQNSKDVVTANKAVIAEHGEELFRLAADKQAEILFEASVAGGIPVIGSLRSGLVANEIESLYGILNGTTNYILTRMTRGEGGYEDILADAQAKGYAEPDPTMDVSGMDAAQKLSILSRIAFNTGGTASEIYCEGIDRIESRDIDYARELGYTIKLLAIAKRNEDVVEARVHPAMVPVGSLLANIHDEYNALEVIGSAVGRQVFYGRGAGQMPTASAVVADLVSLAERKKSGSDSSVGDLISPEQAPRNFADINATEIRYYMRMIVADRPGVLEQAARILASQQISIASVMQQERDLEGGAVPLIIVTHEAREAAMSQAVKELDQLDFVRENVRLIRMEDLGERGDG